LSAACSPVTDRSNVNKASKTTDFGKVVFMAIA